jgi:4-amino-4-deoxy-L-arabinose transferase-like glycosyltransferase
MASFYHRRIAVYGGIFAIFLIWSAVWHSPTVDEAAHLASGIAHIEHGRFELYAVNPPLVHMWCAFPVTLTNVVTEWPEYAYDVASREEFHVGKTFVRVNGPAATWLHTIGRMALLPVALIALSVLIRWCEDLSPLGLGSATGALFVLSPQMLAYSATVTPDFAAAVAGFVAVCFFRQWILDPSWKRTCILGIFTGLAMLTKFTWWLVLPTAAFVFVIVCRSNCSHWYRSVVRDCVQLSLAAVVAVVVVNSCYGFDRSFSRLADIPLISNAFRGECGAEAANQFVGTCLENVPVPLPVCCVLGIDAQKRDFESGFRSYLIGEWKHGGWWYYYLVGFLVKEPIGFQILLYVSVLHGVWCWKMWTRESIREWSFILIPPLLIFGLVSSQTGFSHHMRYVLPAYPFLFIIAARTFTLGPWFRRLTYVCLTWQAVAVLWFAPHWMSYFNEVAGGPENGHDWLVDSNIDWGQDLQGLKWWQDDHPDIELHAALFSGFDPKDIGLKYHLPAPFVAGEPDVVGSSGSRGPQAGWHAVSVNMLKGMHFSIPDGKGGWVFPPEHFTYFFDYFEPVEMIGYSIYIYHITENQAADVREKLLAKEAKLLRRNTASDPASRS